jgi:hypothetical protein
MQNVFRPMCNRCFGLQRGLGFLLWPLRRSNHRFLRGIAKLSHVLLNDEKPLRGEGFLAFRGATSKGSDTLDKYYEKIV